MSKKIGRRLGYRDLFDDEPLDLDSYFIGVSKGVVLKIIAFLITAAGPKSKYRNAEDIIKKWFCTENQAIKLQLLEKVTGGDVIINISSSLELIQFVMRRDFDKEQTISNEEFEINLFKAYLILNSRQEEIEGGGLISVSQSDDPEERLIKLMMLMSYHDSDLRNYGLQNILFCQLVKSVELFKHIEQRKELATHLNLFLSKYHCTSWEEWIKKVLGMILPLFQVEDKSYHDCIIPRDEFFEENCKLFEAFSLSEYDDFEQSDFITLRSKPIIKIAEGHFRILNKLFLIEKLFKSIQFEFSLEINKKVPKSKKIKDFRADFCEKFSENTLLYSTLEKCFPQEWVHLSGEDFKNIGYSAEPDYYLRDRNSIFLFENKDVVLKGEEKQSRDYITLKKALKKKFYKIEESGKVKPKAVLQLIENIKRILTKSYERCDDGYNADTVNIYPILVVHDRQYDSLGLNQLISNWFNEELANWLDEVDILNVHNITILNIDTLILHREVFKDAGDFSFEKLILDFQDVINFDPIKCNSFEELEEKRLQSYEPFSSFVNSLVFQEIGTDMPSYISDYIKELFK